MLLADTEETVCAVPEAATAAGVAAGDDMVPRMSRSARTPITMSRAAARRERRFIVIPHGGMCGTSSRSTRESSVTKRQFTPRVAPLSPYAHYMWPPFGFDDNLMREL